MEFTYSYEQLKTFCEDAFCRFGFNREEAAIITDVLLLSDLYGIESHGTSRLVKYHKDICNGLIDIHAKPEVVFETPLSAVVEGNTRYFIELNDSDYYYMVNVADAQLCAILNVGDRIAIGTMSDSGELRNAYSVERN